MRSKKQSSHQVPEKLSLEQARQVQEYQPWLGAEQAAQPTAEVTAAVAVAAADAIAEGHKGG